MDSKEQLYRDMNALKSVIKTTTQRLENTPEGELRTHSKKKRVDYYWVKPGDVHKNIGTYIRKKDRDIVFSLAQKNYDEKVLKAANCLLESYETFARDLDKYDLKKVYSNLSDVRKQLVNPVILPDDVYFNNWIAKPYQHRTDFEDPQKFVSLRGESMRSKSEVILANLFDSYGIPYKYECPLVFENGIVFYPDFTLLNKRTRKEWRWEHNGMMGKSDYSDRFVQKVNVYEKNGYYQGVNMIYTFENSYFPLNINNCKHLIETFLL